MRGRSLDDEHAPAQSAATKPPSAGLKQGSLNLPRLAFIKTGSSIVWFSLAWAVIGIGWALWWSRRRQLDSISLSAEV
jgi:hypothetical protein